MFHDGHPKQTISKYEHLKHGAFQQMLEATHNIPQPPSTLFKRDEVTGPWSPKTAQGESL